MEKRLIRGDKNLWRIVSIDCWNHAKYVQKKGLNCAFGCHRLPINNLVNNKRNCNSDGASVALDIYSL